MRKTLLAFITLLSLGIILEPVIKAQMQVSNGAVSILAGNAIVGKVGIDQTTPGTTNAIALSTLGVNPVSTGNGTANTGTLRVSIASDQTAFSVRSVPATTCGSTAVSQAIIAVPISSTAVFASTTCLTTAFFNNSNATAQTVTLTDNAGTPLNIIGPAFSVPALSNMVIPFNGIPFSAGVKWLAGGTGVTGGMIGYQ